MIDPLTAPRCIVPDCPHLPPAPGQPCDPCRQAYGSTLPVLNLTRPWPRHSTVPHVSRHRQSGKRFRYDHRHLHRCWLCTHSRMCTRRPHGWECADCRRVS